MGVPDEVEGSVRKRPRLALRTSRKSEPLDTMSSSGDSTPYKSEDTFPSSVSSKLTAANEYVSVTPDLPSSSDPLVPPVASLYNLGNTCFMNSILEVLRYTPGFVEGIEKLNLEIEEESVEEPSNDLQLVWQVVKSTQQLYSDMEAREKQYIKVATCDASSMAVKPTALLDKIRELNPMFEGHYQHDAQELLRCLLCFIEDAHKGLLAIREKRREKMETKREESLVSKQDPLPKCDVDNQHTCSMPASVKVEPESGMVLKGGSTDYSQSVVEVKTRAQSKKLNSGPSRNLIDSYFNLKTESISPAVTCSPANVSPSAEKLKDSHIAICALSSSHIATCALSSSHIATCPVSSSHIATCALSSRKRKRDRAQATKSCPQIHPPGIVGVEVESVHLCRREHGGHSALKGECSYSFGETKANPCNDKQSQPSIDSMFSPVNSLRCSGFKSDKVVEPTSLAGEAIRIDESGRKSPIKDLVTEDTKKGYGCPDNPIDINSDIILKEETVIDLQNSEYTAPCPSESTSLHCVHDVDCVEDILDAHDIEMANIDLTIESVTKGYCSSLPESPSKSSAPSPVMFYPGPTQLIVVSPDCKAAYDREDCSTFSSAGKEAHVILHSPFKLEGAMCTPGDEHKDFEQPKGEVCVKKLFPILNDELPEPSLSLLADATVAPVTPIVKRRVSSSPASPESTWQQTPPLCTETMSSFTSTDKVKDNIPPIKELKMQLKKCDWLGVSPVKSVSASLAISALAESNTPDLEAAKRQIFSDEITVNKTPVHRKSAQVAGSRKSARKKAPTAKTIARTKKEQVAYAQSVMLKPLSIHLDKCDWLLSLNHTVDAKKAMLKFKGNADQKPERLHKALPSHGEAFRERKLMQYSGTLVEHLFGGTMMHRTKCLECELAKERQEVFMDVSVPIKSLQTSDLDSDDDNEDNKDSCLDKLMLAFSNIERLKENNKYFCEECNHYVEAERSCHYTTLPLVLTLHLKRFGSNKGLLGGVSKLNDKVIISQHLPCLHYMCKQNCQDLSHRYSLYGIVTHSGSILSGHYRAYVKVQKAVSPDVFAGLRKGHCRTDPTLASSDISFLGPPPVPEGERSLTAGKDLTPDRDYCRKSLGPASDTTAGARPTCHSVQRSKYFPETERSSRPSSVWLECDDECVRVMEEKDFLSRLEEGDGRAVLGTPYILFYHSLTLV